MSSINNINSASASLSFSEISKNIQTDSFGTQRWSNQSKIPTHQQLFNAIEKNYGNSVANSVFDQLLLSKGNTTPISAFKASKATSEVAHWKKPHNSTIGYTSQIDVVKSLECTTQPFGALNIKNDVNGFVDQTTAIKVGDDTESKGGPVQVRTAALDTSTEDIANRQYKQILSALITANPLLKERFEKDRKTNSNEKPFSFEYANIGLLSAADPTELKTAQQQMEFIQNLKGPINISSDNNPIWVKPTVRYTNFSVEGPEAAKKGSGPDQATEDTLNYYLGKDGSGGTLSAKIPPKVILEENPLRDLLNDVRKLRTARSLGGSSFDSYEFQAKYSLLLEKCGIPTHVYCDSGNDRSLQFTKMSKMWYANPKLDLTKQDSARHIVKSFSLQGNETLARLSKGFSANKANAGYLRLINSLTPSWNLRAKISNQYSSLFYNRGWTKAYTPPPQNKTSNKEENDHSSNGRVHSSLDD